MVTAGQVCGQGGGAVKGGICLASGDSIMYILRINFS